MDEPTFRRARKSDLEPLLVLLKDLHPHDDLVTEEKSGAVWADILENKAVRHYVAESNGLLAATCHLVAVPNLTRGARPYGLIENVVVKKECRRRGIGTQFLQYVLDEAWSLGCYKVMLMTGRNREAVHHFYEKAGFHPG